VKKESLNQVLVLPNIPRLDLEEGKAADAVVSVIVNLILEGKLKDEQRLVEAEMSMWLGVSRTPIREAFIYLARQNLLTREANRSFYVSKWGKKDLWEISTLRANLEGLALKLAMENFTEADIDTLQAIVSQMERATARGDFERLIDLDILFHSTLWGISKHTRLLQALDEIKIQVQRFMQITRLGDELDYAKSHQALIEVLQKGTPEDVEKALREHILSTAERAILRLDI